VGPLGLFAPYVGALEEALEANELRHLLHHARRVAGDHGAGRYVASDHTACTDKRSGSDPDAGQDGGVAANADVVLDDRAEDAVTEAGAGRVRVVRENHPRAQEDAPAECDVLQEALGVYAGPVPDLVAGLEHGVRADAAVIADDVVLSDQRGVAYAQPRAQDGTGVDDAAGADPTPWPDPCCEVARPLSPWRSPHDDVGVQDGPLADEDVGIGLRVHQAHPKRAGLLAGCRECAKLQLVALTGRVVNTVQALHR